MIAADSSVVIAALLPHHEMHSTARSALARNRQRRLIAHVAFESTSTLSRMPRGQRVSPEVVGDALGLMFGEDWIALDADGVRAAYRMAVVGGVRGGALYDALIGATAASVGCRLLSFDRRALSAYEAVGAEVELLRA